MRRYFSVLVVLVSLSYVSIADAEKTLLVVNKVSNTLSLLDPETGEARATLDVGNGPHEVAATSDGRFAVVSNYGPLQSDNHGHTLSVIDISQRSVARTIDLGEHLRPHGLRILPGDRQVLVSVELSEAMIIVDIVTGDVSTVLNAGGDVHMVALSRDAGTAYGTCIQGGQLSVIKLADPQREPRTVDTGENSEALALHPTKNEIWVGNNNEQVVKVVDGDTLEVVATIDCGLQPLRLAFLPDGSTALATLLFTGDLAVIDTATRTVTRRVKLSDAALDVADWQGKSEDEMRTAVMASIGNGGARPIGVLVEPGGRHVYVANRGIGHVAKIDTSTWEIVQRLPAGEGPDGLAWSETAD